MTLDTSQRMIDWQAAGEEATQLLRRYVQIDTTNPPGNERPAAEFLATALRERRLEPQLYESGPGRANLVARVQGEGKRGPVLLLHHMDVVPADADAWSCDPFGGEMCDGYVYGRGAIDMKGLGVMQIVALDLLRRGARPLKRDVILMAVSDEEMEGRHGTGWMVDHHWDEIRPEVVWDEGGFGLSGMVGDGLVFYVAVAEKQVLWPQLVAHGEPGLASVPRGNNPVDRLTRALERIRTHPQPSRLTPVSREMFRRLAVTADFPQSFLLRHIDNPLVWPLAGRALARQPETNAMVRNLVTPTQLRAGSKENVIPQRATAGLDVRLLPDEDVDAFLAELRRIIADDRVEIELARRPVRSSVSPFANEFFSTLEHVLRRNVPGCVVVPMQTPGGTDSRFFRQRGVAAYGLIPIAIDQGELNRMHGIDERISLDNLRLGTRVVYDVLREVCC
jgi:acetylornithine deacetylase/succinyl-diaminopimelate desuccinylase-like protein